MCVCVLDCNRKEGGGGGSRGGGAEKKQKIKSPTNELSQEDAIKLKAQTTLVGSEMSPMGTGSGNVSTTIIGGLLSSCL